MTLIVAFPDRIDQPRALHLVSDSRLSLNNTTWDNATKLFRISPSHHHLAYCGYSAASLIAITQSMAILNASRVLGGGNENTLPPLPSRAKAIENHMVGIFKGFPSAWGRDFSMILAGSYPDCVKFGLFEFKWEKAVFNMIPRDFQTARYHAFGTGSQRFIDIIGPGKGTTTDDILRAVKRVIDDPHITTVGGHLQMVTIRQKGSKPVAFVERVKNGKETFLAGVPLRIHSNLKQVQFLNEAFRPCKYPGDATIKPVGKRRKRPSGPAPSIIYAAKDPEADACVEMDDDPYGKLSILKRSRK